MIVLVVLTHSCFLCLQIHPLEGEAIQVHGMWKRVLSVKDFGRAQNFAHGGVTSQVPRMQQELQPKIKLEDTSSNALWSQQASFGPLGCVPRSVFYQSSFGEFTPWLVSQTVDSGPANAFTKRWSMSLTTFPCSRRSKENFRFLNWGYYEALALL